MDLNNIYGFLVDLKINWVVAMLLLCYLHIYFETSYIENVKISFRREYVCSCIKQYTRGNSAVSVIIYFVIFLSYLEKNNSTLYCYFFRRNIEKTRNYRGTMHDAGRHRSINSGRSQTDAGDVTQATGYHNTSNDTRL